MNISYLLIRLKVGPILLNKINIHMSKVSIVLRDFQKSI